MSDAPLLSPEAPIWEFAIIRAGWHEAAPAVRRLFAHARGRGGGGLGLRDRYRLWRAGATGLFVTGERHIRLVEPRGGAEVTVLICDMQDAFLRGISALLPARDVVQLWSWRESRAREGHGMRVLRAGRQVREVMASRGLERTGVHWGESGGRMFWEDHAAYHTGGPLYRMNRGRLIDYAQRLGFDPLRFAEGAPQARLERLR